MKGIVLAGGSGMLIYSIVGVPLAYGIYEKHRGYGYYKYNDFSIYLNKLDINKVCSINDKTIIIFNSLVDPQFNLYHCK
ncbi:MAG: hypothetical protein U9R03_04835 [Candidatus Aerophobetes bacterium]|nr:hypothetical protein [Candidatus Aerophobetes bacterium]